MALTSLLEMSKFGWLQGLRKLFVEKKFGCGGWI